MPARTPPPPDLKSTAGRRSLKGQPINAALALATAGHYETEVIYHGDRTTMRPRGVKELVLFLDAEQRVQEAW